MIRAVIFDLGGVLVRTEDKTTRQKLAERLGMTYAEISRLVFDTESAIQATLGKGTARAHWEAVQQALNLSADEILLFQEEFWGGDRLDNDLVDFIRSLRPRYKTGLLSNAWDDMRLNVLERYQIQDAFDDIIISAEVKMAKPVPQIYELAISRLGVRPEEAVFVDDFRENIEAAQKVGLQTVHFRNAEQARVELEGLLDPSMAG